ncbi:MAG: hypothetical protein K5888_06395 [Lachnospiraceae bacterium]|nr:hypothetical protein [Lachnospiraceae bacterium]
MDDGITAGKRFEFEKEFTEYANRYVTEEYREAFLHFIEPDSIRESLKTDTIITLRYLINRNGKEAYEMLRMAGVRHPEDRDDHIVHAVGAGFTDIDSEMRDNLAKSQALSDALKSAEQANLAKTAFLSNMSRIESGRIVLRKEEFSFRDMLEQINTMVMSQCNEKGLNQVRDKGYGYRHG